MIIREYYEQLYANKFNSLDEMEKFLERHKLPILPQEEIDNLNNASLLKKLNLWDKYPDYIRNLYNSIAPPPPRTKQSF